MADAPMLARRQIRLAVLAALNIPQFQGISIESPGDWNTPPEALPAILLRGGDERKDSIVKGAPEFTTSIAIVIEARVGAVDEVSAQDGIEALCYCIEMAILTNHELIRIVNHVPTVLTSTLISSDGQIHFGSVEMTFTFEVPEMFDTFGPFNALPAGQLVPLTSFGIHIDAKTPYDPSGTYVDAVFPAVPAPRASGPDGRDEGALDISLPQ